MTAELQVLDLTYEYSCIDSDTMKVSLQSSQSNNVWFFFVISPFFCFMEVVNWKHFQLNHPSKATYAYIMHTSTGTTFKMATFLMEKIVKPAIYFRRKVPTNLSLQGSEP